MIYLIIYIPLKYSKVQSLLYLRVVFRPNLSFSDFLVSFFILELPLFLPMKSRFKCLVLRDAFFSILTQVGYPLHDFKASYISL